MEKYKLFLTLTLIILIKCDTNIENKSQQPNLISKNEEEIIHRFEPYNIYIWPEENLFYQISTDFQII